MKSTEIVIVKPMVIHRYRIFEDHMVYTMSPNRIAGLCHEGEPIRISLERGRSEIQDYAGVGRG